MLLLVMSLGLVVVLMIEARDPAHFAWFAVLTDEPMPIDNRLTPLRAENEIPGTFVSPREVEAEEDTTGRYFPGVKPKYFESIRDDTTFRYQERKAWFNLLEVLDRNDEATLRKASTGRVAFAQLFKQSDDYRGELVTLLGSIRRAHRLSVPKLSVPKLNAPKNEYGIAQYYRMWLWTDDNRTSPMVIYCLYLPEGFPTGMDVSEEVEITGFFFKRWAYQAKDSLRTAPTVLARTVHWHKATPIAASAPMDLVTLAWIVVVAAVFSLLAVIYVFTRTGPGRSVDPS